MVRLSYSHKTSFGIRPAHAMVMIAPPIHVPATVFASSSDESNRFNAPVVGIADCRKIMGQHDGVPKRNTIWHIGCPKLKQESNGTPPPNRRNSRH